MFGREPTLYDGPKGFPLKLIEKVSLIINRCHWRNYNHEGGFYYIDSARTDSSMNRLSIRIVEK